MKLPIKKHKDQRFGIHWSSCSPFIENSLAVLIHRPRRVVTYKISDRHKSHIGVQCWCGNGFSGGKKFTFLDAVPEGKLLCARCEVNAIENGLPSADQLSGRHVHVGRVVPRQVCCL